MDIFMLARIAEMLASIFCMHCLLMDSSDYYRRFIRRLTANNSVQLSGQLASDVDEALRNGGI